MERKEVEKILENIDEDPRNGTPETNRILLKRLQKTANQAKHTGWYPTITQIKMCIHCVYRAHHSFEGGYCAYTDVTGKENGIRLNGYCTAYEMDPRRSEAAIQKDIEKNQYTRPRKKVEPEKPKAKRRPR